MGYTPGASPKGVPLFNASPQTVADFNANREFTEKLGNRRIGTTEERNAATGNDVWEGLEWQDTTDGFEYVYKSGWSRKRDRNVVWIPAVNAGAVTPVISVTFEKAFTEPPFVIIQDTQSGRLSTYELTVTKTGFSFRMTNLTSVNVGGAARPWIAIP